MLRTLLSTFLYATFLYATVLSCASGVQAATIIITDLEDVDFGELPATASQVTERIRICVNSNPAGPYQLTGLGFTGSGAFELSNDAQQTIPYSVYAGRQRNQLGDPLLAGVPRSGFTARQPRGNNDCTPPWLWITIVVSESALEQAASGRYRGTLQLTVAPE